jgi:hypothetical protein
LTALREEALLFSAREFSSTAFFKSMSTEYLRREHKNEAIDVRECAGDVQ